ncbi:hypothetical protein E3T61_03135 [Cryobacterium lactosi]|uniref:DUF927 domain-containing protein n=1 Tax=Cryobacterium lactosi TaxID=1259202 RepID=A0A4R9BY19_9MICO|nr:hypothetical protein [Cryobacterium lactosi]TFD94007.1 hypothetical protein E3T61_03135 [Cryobacterium lactosi]
MQSAMPEALPNNHSSNDWNPDEYGSRLSASGAGLLATGVAPLVAVARGYQTLATDSEVSEFAKLHSFGARSQLKHRLLLENTKDEATFIPWYSVGKLIRAQQPAGNSWPDALQLRPSARFENATGVLTEYVMASGYESVLDAHPATPHEWLQQSPNLLVAEGTVAGDTALTALLREHGMDAELRGVSGSRAEAAQRLRDLMLRVPQEHQVTILNMVGAHRWNGKTVWDELELRGREVVLALDTDPASDWGAWTNLEDFRSFLTGRGASVRWVDVASTAHSGAPLTVTDSNGEHACNAALAEGRGLVSFFADSGSSVGLLLGRSGDLPIKPARKRADAAIGQWKVTEDGNAVELFAVHYPDQIASWRIMTRLGGRVSAIEVHRIPSDAEARTGIFGASDHPGPHDEMPPHDSTCRVEVQWLAVDETVKTASVTGPAALLMRKPKEWDIAKGHIPNELLAEPDWPPQGMDWLKAVKRNNETPPTRSVRWATMGWVPVEGSSVCSFISGRTIISPNSVDRQRTLAGVSDLVLPGSSGFSLPPMNEDVMSPSWIRQVRDDLIAVREAYINNAPWTDANVGAVVLAAGMRPAVPVTCTTSIWLQGPPGSAKSWTASMMLAFHQNSQKWTDKSLPGSMKDTPTGSEQALAQSNIWVMDDLAPSPSRQSNDSEQRNIGEIVRSVYNHSAKRRSGVDLKARELFVPHALLVVTSENEHSINSVRDRAIIVEFGADALRSDEARDQMVRFRDHNRAPGRLLVAAVQAYQYLAMRDGWAPLVESLRGVSYDGGTLGERCSDVSVMDQYLRVARDVLSRVKASGKSDARHVEMAVDLMLGLDPLKNLAELVGDTETADLLDVSRSDSLPARVAAFAASSFRSQLGATPGLVFLEAVRNILAAGQAHVENASKPNLPPLPEGDVFGNRALGWQPDGKGILRPLGESIGELKKTRGGATDTIMLHATNAFSSAQRHHRKLLPAGSSARAVLESVWGEKLTHPECEREIGRVDIKYKVNGRQRRGVPIQLNQILGELAEPEPASA